MILRLDAKRRLTVPAGLAPASPGDAFEARFDAEESEIVFRRIAGAGDLGQGSLSRELPIEVLQLTFSCCGSEPRRLLLRS